MGIEFLFGGDENGRGDGCTAMNILKSTECYFILFYVFKDFIYLFLDRAEGREKERNRNISVWLPLKYPLLRTWAKTQACALTGNRTGDPLVRRPVFNPLSHTRQR